MWKKTVTVMVAVALLSVSACAGKSTPKVASLQKKDKNLSCREVELEINEAEFYRKTAENNKNPSVKSLLMPLGYISTYVNAEDAAGAANARIDYLNRIYDILNCDDPVARQMSQGAPIQGGGYSANTARYVPADRYYHAEPSAVRPVAGANNQQEPEPYTKNYYW